jgi:Putative metal-binding motif/RTX calcium-binding nonapeptide repeat (4 copies)
MPWTMGRGPPATVRYLRLCAKRTTRLLLTLALAAIVMLATLLAATPAPASSSLTYTTDSGTLSVTANDPTVAISLFQFNDTGCAPFCDSRLDVRSAQGFTETPDTSRCTDPVGDATFFQCRPVPSTAEVTGSPGADTLTATGGGAVACPDPTVHLVGLGGPDELRSGCAADRLDGGDGRDTLDGGAGADELDGGPEADVLDGGPGTDALRGGDGRDLLIPGVGSDIISGGPSADTVSYEERANPVAVTIGGVADDGEFGEADTVADDVENVVGGAGADVISGSAAANDIDSGPGADVVNPGGGADVVDAGPGDDTIGARDGVQDLIVCGDGTDRVTADAFDSLDGCEVADVSRELMADVDNDGLAAPEDCQDRDPRVRPGLPDRPGDGIDQDCRGGDAPFPRVLTGVSGGWRIHTKYLQFIKLELVDVPDHATVELSCRGGGCFKGVRRRSLPRGAERVKLTQNVTRSKLRPRAMLEVRILRTDTIGKVVRFTVRKGKKDPTTRILCLRPGAKLPRACR